MKKKTIITLSLKKNIKLLSLVNTWKIIYNNTETPMKCILLYTLTIKTYVVNMFHLTMVILQMNWRSITMSSVDFPRLHRAKFSMHVQ